MIQRSLQLKLISAAQKMPVITLTGPRQSGKSTLVKQSFPEYTYVNLEKPSTRLFAKEDPTAFLEK
ncbi:MAG: AAA family ATPase, partial [Bacteroidetes bacterium]|nr:AAA family ATPase [Bacteroidota bacterium]